MAYLRSEGADPIFTVGFCFGGRNSWLSAAGGHGIAGAVGFYGMPGERNGQPGPTQRAAELAAPILALQAGDDANITAEHNAAFDAALTEAGVGHELDHVRGRAPQLLRPEVRGLRRRLGGRLAADARLHRRELLVEGSQLLNGFRIRTALASWSCWTLKV